MSDEKTTAEPSGADGGSALDCLSAYLKWRDEKIASGVSDVNPFMVWNAGVRYAIESIRRNDRFSSESGFPASENAVIAENQSESTAFPSGKDCTETVAK
jgi:hypothetical protein